MAEPKHGCRPIGVEETPGKKAYCTCGWSEKLPYCDGAHARMGTGCQPKVLEITPADAGKKWVCQCHQSKTMPWCDGTHKHVE
jgi:CDGSH-type Zn-finger protein